MVDAGCWLVAVGDCVYSFISPATSDMRLANHTTSPNSSRIDTLFLFQLSFIYHCQTILDQSLKLDHVFFDKITWKSFLQ